MEVGSEGLVTSPTMVVLAMVAGLAAGERVTCRPGYVPSQEVTYTEDSLSGLSLCQPCLETSTAYYGNNLRQAPDYGVGSVQACRALCRGEPGCEFFTYDSENSWCYLKSAKTSSPLKTEGDKRYTSGPKSEDCQSDEENEIEYNKAEIILIEENRAAKALAKVERNITANVTVSENTTSSEIEKKTTETSEKSDKTETNVSKSDEKPRVPILSVFHDDGSRTVLTALPATFGLKLRNDTKVSGQLVLLPSSMCSPQPSIQLRPWLLSWRGGKESKLFAAVRRGGCRFAKKALHAAAAGFAGLVILDDQDDTSTPRISGKHSSALDSFPTIFLLKTEAKILEKHLMEDTSLSVAIQDSSTFSWYSSRTSTARPEKQIKKDGFLMGMRDPPSRAWPFGGRRPPPFLPSRPRPSSSPRPSNKIHQETVFTESEAPPAPGSILQMSPLTLGSLIVGVLVLLLLITSVTTLLVSRYTRRKRRRANHTRCQLAIRNMEAQGSGSHENSGYSGGEEGRGATFPKAARNLLECPVCLELAWPPRRIYQCREGHIICEECRNNPALKVCPMCRTPLANNLTSRNRQLEELARTLKEEDGTCSPSAPPHPSLTSLTLTASPPIPPSVFTVTTSVDIETPSLPREEGEEHEVEGRLEGGGGLLSSPRVAEGAGMVLEPEGVEHHRVTSSVAAGPLTVVLPPEYQHQH